MSSKKIEQRYLMPYFPFSFENTTFDWAAGELLAFSLVLGGGGGGEGAQVERSCGFHLPFAWVLVKGHRGSANAQ